MCEFWLSNSPSRGNTFDDRCSTDILKHNTMCLSCLHLFKERLIYIQSISRFLYYTYLPSLRSLITIVIPVIFEDITISSLIYLRLQLHYEPLKLTFIAFHTFLNQIFNIRRNTPSNSVRSQQS